MVEANFAVTKVEKVEEKKEFIPKNVEADDFINQAKGLRAVKERKRREKIRLNKSKFAHTQPLTPLGAIIKARDSRNKLFDKTKQQKVSDQIQRGFDIATKWRNENVVIPVA